jgi:hypothetical protein
MLKIPFSTVTLDKFMELCDLDRDGSCRRVGFGTRLGEGAAVRRARGAASGQLPQLVHRRGACHLCGDAVPIDGNYFLYCTGFE